MDAVSFEAEHFTVYAVAARAGAETKYVGDTWSVEARDGDKNYFWETSNSSVVKIVYSDLVVLVISIAIMVMRIWKQSGLGRQHYTLQSAS